MSLTWYFLYHSHRHDGKYVKIPSKTVSNTRPIAKPKPKMDLQHNTYSLQQNTYMVDSF